jgi:hypothetical protein
MLKLKYFILCVVALAAIAILSFILEPKVEKVAYEKSDVVMANTDSLLVDGQWEDRQAGYVNLDKFVSLASKSSRFVSYSRAGRDSVTFKSTEPIFFFGKDAVLLDSKNLGISIGEDRKSFTAEVKEIDDVKYVYMPYHILKTVADKVWNKPAGQ